MGRFACVAALVMVLGVPNAAARTLKVRWGQDALVAYRVWDEVGFIPIKSIQPDIFKRRTVKVGSTTYKVLWTNTTSNRQTTTMALRQALHDSAYPAVFTDRDLTAVE